MSGYYMGISLNMEGINRLNNALLQGKGGKIKRRSILLFLFPVLGKDYEQVDREFNHLFNLSILLNKSWCVPISTREIRHRKDMGEKARQ